MMAAYVSTRCGGVALGRCGDTAIIVMQVPLSTIPGLEMDALIPCLRSFYASLFSLSMPSFDRLTYPRLRVRARRGTAQLIANAYKVRRR
jgi:hypothetical protein